MTRNQILQFLQQNTVLIIVIASMGLSALQWLLRKLEEQRQLNEARRRQAAREYEAVRTGRAPAPPAPTDPPPPAPPPASTARDELRRRMDILAKQKQLEELRRRQRASGRAAAGIPSAVRLPKAGPVSPGPIVGASPRPPRVKPQKPQRQPGAPKRQTTSPPSPVAGTPATRPGEVSRSLPATQWQSDPHDAPTSGGSLTPAVASKASLLGSAPAPAAPSERPKSSAEQWRQAIVLAEAISSPVCLRSPLDSSDVRRAF